MVCPVRRATTPWIVTPENEFLPSPDFLAFPPGSPANYIQLALQCVDRHPANRPDFGSIERCLTVRCWRQVLAARRRSAATLVPAAATLVPAAEKAHPCPSCREGPRGKPHGPTWQALWRMPAERPLFRLVCVQVISQGLQAAPSPPVAACLPEPALAQLPEDGEPSMARGAPPPPQ